MARGAASTRSFAERWSEALFSVSLCIMKKSQLLILLGLLLPLWAGFAQAPQNTYKYSEGDLPKSIFADIDFAKMNSWIEQEMYAMSQEELVGQLIMPIVYPSTEASKIAAAKSLVVKQHIGGILFQKGSPADQWRMTETLQTTAKRPLLISLDGEWGLAMRLSNTQRYPRNMGLGNVKDKQLLYNYGREIARQCRLMGIHINFAPSLDVNNNPLNPVIGTRSFGDDPKQVAERGLLYATGLEDGKVLSVAKHFPGHGNTFEDSHHTLPIVSSSRGDLNKVELHPFSQYINAGLGGMMTAHLSVAALEPRPNVPTSLSPLVCTELLQKQLGFKGLIFTDGLAMEGAQAKGGEPIGVRAIRAGNDVLLGPIDPVRTHDELMSALRNGSLSLERIKQSVRKILAYKYALIINPKSEVAKSPSTLLAELNNSAAKELNQKLWEGSIRIKKNLGNTLPLGSKNGLAIVQVGGTAASFVQACGIAAKNVFTLPKEAAKQNSLLNSLKSYRQVIVAINNSKPKGYADVLRRLAMQQSVTLCFITNPYAELQLSAAADKAQAIVHSYEATADAQRAAAKALFAKPELTAIRASNVLPQSGDSFDSSEDRSISNRISLLPQSSSEADEEYPLPYALNKYNGLKAIDQIAQEGVDMRAYPGCQVMVIESGKVIYEKCFGTLEGKKGSRQVSPQTLYDLASISKAVATTPATMLMVADGKLKLDSRVGEVLDEFVGTPIERISVRELLLHQSGLPASINFYLSLINPASYDGNLISYKNKASWVRLDRNAWGNPKFQFEPSLVSNGPKSGYTSRFSSELYLSPKVKELMMASISSAKLSNKRYRYSDVGFILLQQMIERVAAQDLDQLVENRIYKAVGAKRLCFLPLGRFDINEIAPSQDDRFIRKSEVRGTVDDESAACLGGVAGNAGVFGSARDLARVLTLFTNKGKYHNQQVIPSAQVAQFINSTGLNGRRSLGFDKGRTSMADAASTSCYGHTGFTGTCFWIDPEHELIFIFLSNRTYPSRLNKKLMTESIRPRIHQAIYEAIGLA